MKRKLIYFAGLALMGLCGCTKAIEPVEPEYMEISVTTDASKTSLNGSKVLWSEGDKIRVFSNSNSSGSVYRLSSGAGTGSANFYGPVVSGSTFYAAYPKTTTFNGSTFTYTLPSEVDYTPGSFANESAPMLGSGSDVNVAMKNLCGVVKFQFKGDIEDITSFEFTFSDPVCGPGTVSVGGTTLTMTGGSDAYKKATMNFGSSLMSLTSSYKDFYLVVPAGTYDGVSIKTNIAGDNYSVKNVGAFTVTRSSITTLQGTLPAPELDERPTITTCSFNIYSQGMDGKSESSQKWDNRKAGIYAFLNEQDFDVFCTQECEYRQRTAILANLNSAYSAYGKGCWLGNEKDSGREYDWDLWEYVYNNEDAANTIFYKTALFNVLDKGTFWLTSSTPSSPAKYSKSKHYHACSWMKLEYKSNGYKFYVFNTHLENGYNDDGDATRAYEMPILYNKVNQINTEELPMFITGDFNGSTTDLWGYCDDCHYGWYWARNQDGKTNKDNYPASLNNWKSWPENQGSNVDHIAYKFFYDESAGGKHGLVKGSFKTFNEPYAGVTFLSDHWPIKATFVFNWQ